MAQPIKLNLKVYQGATFRETLRWESSTKVYKPISGITKAAPVVITAVGHGMPVGWRTKITNVAGMTELNSNDTYHTVTDVTTDTVTINAINALGYKDYTTGGVLEYNEPVSLAGYTGRMQIRGKLEDTEVVLELTTANGGIVIDDTNKTITILITAAQSTTLTFSSAVYSLELVNGSEVVPFLTGGISLIKEVTR